MTVINEGRFIFSSFGFTVNTKSALKTNKLKSCHFSKPAMNLSNLFVEL